MEDKILTIPAVALRGMTILPGMVAHFDISRDKSLRAVEEAMKGDQKLFIVTQKDTEKEDPQGEDLYEVGLLAVVRQVVKLQKNIMRVLIEGIGRAEIYEYTQTADYMQARVIVYDQEDDEQLPEQAKSAMLLSVQETFAKYARVHGKIGQDVMRQVQEETDLLKLLDYVGNSLVISYKKKQKLLEAVTLTARYEAVLSSLLQETEILALKRDFQKKVQEHVDKNQKDYLLREQMQVIREELGESNTETDAQEYEKKLQELQASGEVKARIHKEIERFQGISGNSSESTVSRGYIETLLELPWDAVSEDNKDLKHAQKILDEDHYGLEKVKERILEFLAVRNLTGKGESPIICLVGPPGTGKTSIARSIARALDKKYVRISLGGVRDEAEIRGHRRTYIGSMPGRIINALQHAGTNNPVLILDEIDKLAADYKGDPTSALLEVLDIEQNNKFVDHYIELPFDLSNVMFITTANDISAIPAPLRDRMEIIEISSYTREEKFHIAKKHLIPKQLEECGFTSKELKFTQKAIYALIDFYTREAGVRTLERLIASVMRKCAVEKLTEGTEVFKIDEKEIERFLGHKKFIPDSLAKMDEIGIVNGLAWTSVGGEILPIEVAVMEGTGKIELTGSLGDVMQESAKTAITCIRSHAAVLGIDSDFYKNKDIHIHAPEGAVPKDGPSAGITMATAIYSALTLKPVRHDIAMTGEITLRGNVLPIGGLKEKSMAAFKNGITTVIIPKDNEPDLEDVDKAVLEKVKFIPVRNFSEVVALAVNNTVRITDNQWNGIDMTAVRSATKTVNAVKQ